MSIKKTQAILECFIDLKCGVWFTLGSADETTFCDTQNYSPQISQNGKIPANLNYHMSIKKTQAILECFIDLKCGVWFTLGSADETTFCDTQNYSPQISQNGKIPANLNYHMSIKKTQAILECFIDLKCGVWFTLGSADETTFCDTQNFFQLISQNRKIPANLIYHMSITKIQAILKCLIDLNCSVWFTLGSEDETMFCDT